MQFTGKLTDADLNDVERMNRSKLYWLKLPLENLYGTGILVGVIWATIARLLGQTTVDWRVIALIWAVIAGIVLLVVQSTKKARVRELAQMNATLPDHISLTSDGVKFDGPNGSTAFVPWRNFKGWREGRRVMLVDPCEETRFVMLPVAQLSEIERQPIRQFLQSRIPSASR